MTGQLSLLAPAFARSLSISMAAILGLTSPVLAQDAPAASGTPASETAAQTAPQTGNSDEIVVTGRVVRLTPSKIHRQARDISVASDIFDTPIARMETHLCPGVVGLQAEYAGQMIDRIRYQADRLDVPLASDGCRANMVVVFAENGQELLNSMYKNSSYMFKNITVPERRRLLADPGPVHVWSQVETRGRDGQAIARRDDLVNPPRVSMWGAHSLIYKPIRKDITSVMIVINLEDAADKTLAQLADYSVMRGLVRTNPRPGMAMDSILGLFEVGGPYPLSLTDFDQAYLNAIYDGIPNIPAASKLGSINRELRKIHEADEE